MSGRSGDNADGGPTGAVPRACSPVACSLTAARAANASPPKSAKSSWDPQLIPCVEAVALPSQPLPVEQMSSRQVRAVQRLGRLSGREERSRTRFDAKPHAVLVARVDSQLDGLCGAVGSAAAAGGFDELAAREDGEPQLVWIRGRVRVSGDCSTSRGQGHELAAHRGPRVSSPPSAAGACLASPIRRRRRFGRLGGNLPLGGRGHGGSVTCHGVCPRRGRHHPVAWWPCGSGPDRCRS